MLELESWTSVVEPTFWHALAQLKLNALKLDESMVPIDSFYELGKIIPTESSSSTSCFLPSCLNLNTSSISFNDNERNSLPPYTCTIPGQLKLLNTLEAFRQFDKQSLFLSTSAAIWNAIESHHALENPLSLLQFLLIAFADLKTHHFYYWFAFPSVSKYPLIQSLQIRNLSTLYSPADLDCISNLCKEHFREIFFLLHSPSPNNFQYEPLKKIGHVFTKSEKPCIVFSDPSSLPDRAGWPLKNLLALLCYLGYTQATILCCRHDTFTRFTSSKSISLFMELSFSSTTIEKIPNFVGWERSHEGKLAPKFVNLSHMMDPNALAESAVNLNLKLMKWRLLPSLDLDAISQCKCLILGAGTLGCHVARNLLAWGVHTISLVDYGKVSYSNPVRQPLYVFEDCLGGGISKSKAASKRLKEIYPNVIVNGYDITIPMPGHPILEEKTFVETMSLLEHLFKEHDVIFILLDSREGRWLPTLLGTIGDKIVINAALGFDSFVVMRHSSKLGCYFCNDVVAPTDSLFNRTLDQQCTVTRPGLSAITGAYAVEMLASIMNHPQRHHAASLSTDSCLGILPQQLRGFLNTLETLCISGEAYPQCTACSTYVQKHYEQWGFDFIRQVCNDSEILESITGLNDIKNKIDSIGDLSLSDDDFDCS